LQNSMYICCMIGNKNIMDNVPDKYKPFLWPNNLSKGQLLKSLDGDDAMELYNKAWDKIKAFKR